jgi:CRISPR/Cas system endoribonuclease Cas6 (RAMP superfamily)
VHGGETIIPSGTNIIVQVMLNDKVLAEQMIDLSSRNVSGFGNKFTPKKRNIKNYQEIGV